VNEYLPNHLKIILTEMYKRVKADPTKINTKEGDWLRKYSWTEQEQDSFAEWMTDYLYNNKEARKEILTQNIKSKKRIRLGVNGFLFNYGWRLK
jgi:hypothetical protein